MRSPIVALTWEIWRRNRRLAWAAAGVILFACLFNLFLPPSCRATKNQRDDIMAINGLLTAISYAFVFGIFNYTEFNRQKEWTGFPYRLFTLPVPTWLLVALPIALGVAAAELSIVPWMTPVFRHSELVRPGWLAVMIGAYMVFYQTILWCLAGSRMVRLLVLGIVGTSFIGVYFLPSFGNSLSSPWLSEAILVPLLFGLAFAAFLFAWWSVARERSAGGRRHSGLKELGNRVADFLPRRRKSFSSPAAAQFWFEWRHSGSLLPVCAGAILILIIAPLSWVFRSDPETTLWILTWALAMPMLLAAPIGKAFSKPDFWSDDLSVPPFVAVRPLASGEIVVVKMKVAALSTFICWLLVFGFLAVWLSTWANLDDLNLIRIGFWLLYQHSVYPQYAIAALSLLAALCLTWKFMVGGLWIGLSGSRKWFTRFGAIYSVMVIGGFIAVIILGREKPVRDWLRENPDRFVAFIEWGLALAVIAKFWLAAFSWRRISAERVRRYFLLWLGGTAAFISLAIVIWARGGIGLLTMEFLHFRPEDVYRLKHLLLLAALLPIPFARLGLAARSLAKNRHG